MQLKLLNSIYFGIGNCILLKIAEGIPLLSAYQLGDPVTCVGLVQVRYVRG